MWMDAGFALGGEESVLDLPKCWSINSVSVVLLRKVGATNDLSLRAL